MDRAPKDFRFDSSDFYCAGSRFPRHSLLCFLSFGGDMTRLRALILLLALCILLPALALPPQVPVPQKSAAPATTARSQQSSPTAPPSTHPLEKADLEAFFDGLVPLQMERSDVAGATVLVMKDGAELLKKGYGYSDITKKSPVDPDTSMFRLASISKLFTWVSVMQLCEQGKLDIDADVNKYLDFEIAPAFGKPITLRHLMTHTGGFEEVLHDIIFINPKNAHSLRDFIMQNQPRRMYPPGEIPAYSNYGVGLAGYIVERVSAEPFEQYVSEHIFLPLGMKHSSFNEPMTAELAPYVSDGYRATTEKPAIGFEIFNPAPAGGISSAAGDMEKFALALLNGGELDGHRILKTETRDAMWTRQFGTSDALPPQCMGFYQTWRNNLHFIGHDGDLIAFHSMFLLEPAQKLVVFVSYNSAGSAQRNRAELLDGFADRYFPAYTPPAFQSIPAEQLKDIAGNFESTRRADSTKLAIGNPAGQSILSVDKDGVLTIDTAKDLRGHTRKWKPIAKDLWQVDDEQARLLAIRDSSGKIVRLAVNFPGVQLQRVPWYEHKSFIGISLAISLLILLPVVAASLLRFFRRLFFRKRLEWKPQPGTLWVTLGARLAAFTWIIVAIWLAALTLNLQSEALPSFPAIQRYFSLITWFSILAAFFSILALVAGVRIWQRADVRTISRVKFSLVAAACVFLTWYSIHWNLIGPIRRF
jgi:CubicO group peptidase (beta-lactamase class C family)